MDELIWVKTNSLRRLIVSGRTGHWLNHSKEHCLVGYKGRPVINRWGHYATLWGCTFYSELLGYPMRRHDHTCSNLCTCQVLICWPIGAARKA